jgi:hypothetical protein
MANTLTALQPILFSAAQEVSQEPWGAMDSIALDFDDKGVAKGDTVRVPIAPTRSASDFTPSNNSSTGADATADNVDVTITKSRYVGWHLTGEQIRTLENANENNRPEWVRQLVAQGMRTLRNEAEADAVEAIKLGASRATGTAGGSPFSSSIDAMVDLRKILRDNGAPMSDLQMVFDTSDAADLMKLNIYQQADLAGSPEERRTGRMRPQYGFMLRESAGISQHTAGAASGYLLNGAVAEDVQEWTVDGGSGSFNPGDVITVDGDQYVVQSDVSSNVLTVNRPGAVKGLDNDTAIGASGDGDYTPILGFERNAVVGITRPPLFPPNANHEETLISDTEGNTFLLVQISQYGQVTWELHLAWGFKAVQQEHIAILLS